jgi:hypothetical protein
MRARGNETRRQLATRDAAKRLQEIELEMKSILRAFPDLRVRGGQEHHLHLVAGGARQLARLK